MSSMRRVVVLETGHHVGNDVGDAPDLVHPAHDLPDLPDRHRDGGRIG